MDREGSAIQKVPDELIIKIHALARALFTEELTRSEENHPAMVCSMVSAVSEAGEVKPPRQICSLLAKVQYCIRATVLYEVVRVAHAKSIDYDSALDPLLCWVTSTHPSIYRAIRHGIRLSAKACFGEVGAPKIMPSNTSGTAFDFRGVQWDLAELKKYYTSLPQTCADKIASLMAKVNCDDIWDKITSGPSGRGLREDVGKESTGYSAFKDPANEVREVWRIVLRRMLEAGELHGWFNDLESQDGKGRFEWNDSSCKEFVAEADDICRALHLATFESFSTPPRAEEFAATLICDTSDRGRNLLMINYIMTYILRYCKTTTNTGYENPTCRVVPTTIMHLTAFFICVIRPIAWFLSAHVLKLDKEKTEPLKTHLWWLVLPGRYLKADDLTTGMRKEISRTVDPKYKAVYGVRANRHIKKYLGRQFLPHHPTAKLINARAQNIFELQTGHSQATALMFYAKQGGKDHHPEIDARLLREHQCVGQAMLSILGFAPPPEGNLELAAEEPPSWVFDAVESPNSLPQRPLPRRDRSTEPSVLQPRTNSGLEDALRATQHHQYFKPSNRVAHSGKENRPKRKSSPNLPSESEEGDSDSRERKKRRKKYQHFAVVWAKERAMKAARAVKRKSKK
ncbi:hypothetical protein FRC01_013787 [Tulasnella sp. 417]|nr:hypothetical protein FRC01_013787 [Tulasnella sp. 417]